MSDCCPLQLNPDITGIGVRVGLYAQILLGWMTSLVWHDTFAENARASYMTAIALIIAAFIQLQTQTLSLLDGIVVSLITSMMITFAISSSPPGPKKKTSNGNAEGEDTEADPNHSRMRYVMQFVFVGFWAGWCLYMWRDPVHFGLFGNQYNCTTNTQVTIVIFGREIQATDPRMRNAAIALVVSGLVIAVGSLFMSLKTFLHPVLRLFDKTRPEPKDVNEHEDPALKSIRWFLQHMSFATLIYLVVSTEQTIKRNDLKNATTQWTYGQTIAVILLLQQIMDICSKYMEKKEEKKEEGRKKEKEGSDQGSIALSQFGRNRSIRSRSPGSRSPRSRSPN